MDNTISYNMAELTNDRINSILKRLSINRVREDTFYLYKWVRELYLEVIPYLSNKERIKYRDQMREISNLKPLKVKGGHEVSTLLVALINDFEESSRIHLYNKGILTAKGQDPSKLL